MFTSMPPSYCTLVRSSTNNNIKKQYRMSLEDVYSDEVCNLNDELSLSLSLSPSLTLSLSRFLYSLVYPPPLSLTLSLFLSFPNFSGPWLIRCHLEFLFSFWYFSLRIYKVSFLIFRLEIFFFSHCSCDLFFITGFVLLVIFQIFCLHYFIYLFLFAFKRLSLFYSLFYLTDSFSKEFYKCFFSVSFTLI